PSPTPEPSAGTLDVGTRDALRLADALTKRGRAAAAADVYRMLLREQPDCMPAHARLALVLLGLRGYEEATPHFRATLARYPTDVPALVGLAYALQHQRQWREASWRYREALTVSRDCVQALLGLCVCMRAEGRLQEACECVERALAIDPACTDAYHLLSSLHRVSADDPMYMRCEAMQAEVSLLAPARQARYWFALGRLREDIPDYDAAFAAYATGNRIRASLLALDESDEEPWFARTRAVFDAPRLAAYPRVTAHDRVPVFVVGMPRSGTTLIEQILASHPQVHGAGEVSDLRDVLAARLGEAPNDWDTRIEELSVDDLRTMGNAYIVRAWRAAPAATHVINKVPLNYRHIGWIRMILPQARILHACRDPMDSCFSCFTHLFEADNLAYTYDLATLGRYYDRYARLMRHWHAVVPDAVLDVHYEDVVADTEAQVRRMLDWLGLPWDPRCLAFHHTRRFVATASVAQVRRPIYRSSVARWKHFENHLGPLRELVEPWR
ncbi:MAG: sulfotransferase, partial [Rhodanobacteraceae bacterium]